MLDTITPPRFDEPVEVDTALALGSFVVGGHGGIVEGTVRSVSSLADREGNQAPWLGVVDEPVKFEIQQLVES